MCILKDCANPTGEGVWWRDDTKWCLYSPQHQDLIKKSIENKLKQIDLGTITSTVHPQGQRYTVDLQAMEQAAVKSGQKRPIMVIDSLKMKMATLQLEGPPEETQLPGGFSRNFPMRVHYRDSSGNLKRYDPDIAKKLCQAMAHGTQRTLLVQDGQSGEHYLFDIEAMVQHFVARVSHDGPVLSDKAPVTVIVEVPWDPTAMASIALKADKCMRRKILVMVIDRYRSDEHLDAILPVKARPKTVVSKSTSAICGPGSPLYEKFVDSLEVELEAAPKEVFGDVIKQSEISITELGGTGGPVQMVFKPAERLSRAAGSKSSDGEAKSRTAFWTSMAAPMAAAHAVVYGCAAQLRIVAYLVIIPVAYGKSPRASRLGDGCSGFVQVDKPEHRLPLAEVTVC